MTTIRDIALTGAMACLLVVFGLLAPFAWAFEQVDKLFFKLADRRGW